MNSWQPGTPPSGDASAPDALFIVHGELVSSDDWEIVDGVGSGAARHVPAFAEPGFLDWDGWDLPVASQLPAPASGEDAWG